jgi:hypothetical protein
MDNEWLIGIHKRAARLLLIFSVVHLSLHLKMITAFFTKTRKNTLSKKDKVFSALSV